MHEYHIVEDLVKQVLKKAEAGGARKVTRVALVLGAQSGLEESSVRLYFENLSKGTLLEGAQLIVSRLPDTAQGLSLEHIEIRKE